MRFRDLYNLIEAQEQPPIKFDTLKQLVSAHHAGVGTVTVYAVKYPSPTRQAHYRMVDMDRSSPYEDEYGDVEITYCDSLDSDPLERRYALTKELMHVFDSPDQRVDSREKFVRLLREIQNKPMPAHASPAFHSEMDTRWMALVILCPRNLRNKHLAAYRADEIEDFDIAELFRIPEWVVPFVMDDYYEEAFKLLMNGKPTQLEEQEQDPNLPGFE